MMPGEALYRISGNHHHIDRSDCQPTDNAAGGSDYLSRYTRTNSVFSGANGPQYNQIRSELSGRIDIREPEGGYEPDTLLFQFPPHLDSLSSALCM